MHATGWRRVARIRLLAVLAIGSAILGCDGSQPDEREIRSMIAFAAAASAGDVLSAAERGLEGEAWVDATRDQRLTMVLMALVNRGPFCREDGKYLAEQGPPREFEYLTLETDPVVLAECFWAPSGDRRTAARIAAELNRRSRGEAVTKERVVAAIWPEYVTDLDWTINGEQLDGTVAYEAPGCWRGELSFVARQSGGEWRVEEFHLPVLGWSVSLEASGSWRATRTGLGERISPLEEIDFSRNGASVFSGKFGMAHRPTVVGFSRGGAVEPIGPTAATGPSGALGQSVDERAVVLIPLQPDLTIADFLDALDALRMAVPSTPVVGLSDRGDSSEGGEAGTAVRKVGMLTDLAEVRIPESIDSGPRFCISPTAIHVSTGQEVPLALYHAGEVFEFADYEVQRNKDRMFLVNAQPEAPYRILEWVLDAIVRAGGKGAFFATERYRGIALLNRNR